MDGRNLRRKRAIDHVVDTACDMIAEGDAEPSAIAVADRTGISCRSIYRYMAVHNADSVLDLVVLWLQASPPVNETIVNVTEAWICDPLGRRVACVRREEHPNPPTAIAFVP